MNGLCHNAPWKMTTAGVSAGSAPTGQPTPRGSGVGLVA